jgi:gliding motility-associated-like protein
MNRLLLLFKRGTKKKWLPGLALLFCVTGFSQPTINQFTPDNGAVGTLVTITGTNLNNPSAIMIGGIAAIPISNDGTTLVAMLMPGATTGGVSVTTGGGTANGSGNFVVIPTQFPNFQQGNKYSGTGITSSSYLGWSVDVSADGNTAIIGCPVDNVLIGGALIYVRNGTTWTQQAKLVGSGNVSFSQQGTGVALSADGNTAIVGGNRDNDFVGAAWIFTRTGNVWTQQGNKLVGSDALFRSNQGWGVDISADGNTVLIGGLGDWGGIGASWIFTRTGNTWTQQGSKLVGTGRVGLSYQGWSVSISADATTALIGGYVDDNFKGAAWIFVRSGNSWVQQGNKLVGAGAVGNAQQGWKTSISADGNTAIIGGNADDNSKGAAWIFTRNSGTWSQQGNKLVGTGAIGNANQGKSVALSADGNTAIIGGAGDNGGAGAAWTFTRMGNAWLQQCSKLIGSGAAGAANQGESVSISSDGNTALIGGYTDNGGDGAAWSFIHIPPPVLTSFDPTAAGAGTVITITGSNFTHTSAVSLGGTPVSSFTVVSSGSINARVGTGSSGLVSVISVGCEASLSGFSFIPAPIITSFSPTAAATGALITIIGSHFDNTLAVSLGGISVRSFTVVSSTTIVATVGNGSTGAVSLTTPGGTASLAGFTYIPPPTITSFAPTTAAAGALINITGTNFDGTFALTLGGTSVSSFTVISSTSIVAIVGIGSSGAVSLTTPGGTASLAGFIFIPAPTITSFSPLAAGSGMMITITGTNFNGTSIITLGGTPVLAFTVVSSTSIVAMVGAGSSGAVSLTTPGGTASLAGFTFILPPTITAFAPITAAAGALITITGTNFNNTSAITLGGIPVTSFTVISSTSILAIVGMGATGAVSLTTPGGTASLAGFTFIPAPTITAFAPNTAAAGALISITGTNFDNTFVLTLGGTPVAAFTVVSSTSIVARVSSGSTGAVSLTTPGGTASLAGFTFIPAPTITSFAPTTAAAGALISITGTNFNNTSAITLGGTPVAAFTVVSSTSIVAIVGTGSGGAVSLTTPGGTASLAGFTFIPAPTITSFAPNTAAAGALISITGTNFNNAFAITLGGIPVTSFTVVSSTSLLAIVGLGATGAVSLTTPGGTASLAGFTFIPAPTITSFAPTSAGAGALLNITGTNFNNVFAITLGGTPVAAFTVVSSTSIVAIVGTGSSGAVSLTTPGGTASLAGFTFIPAPTITAFAPTTAAAGALISITGTNFNNTSAITLGGTPVTSFTVVSSTSIVAIVGTGSSGAVSLTTPGGTASLAGFTFIPAPTITAFAPNTAAAGALMSITGTNFNNTFAITLGGIPVTSFTIISSTSIVAIVGNGSTGAVSLTTPGGTASLDGFTFIPAPTISSFDPIIAASGAIINITGTNFNGTFIVTLGDTPVSSFTVVSSTSIIAIVGTGSSGAVSLTTPGGTASLAGFTFIPAPTITSFAPTSAGAGALLNISGTNFNNTSVITLGGIPVASFTVLSSTSIIAVVGTGSTGAVSLTTPGGSASLDGFTFIPAPTITSFAPTAAAEGMAITITGTHFTGTFALTLGGTPVAFFTVLSSTTIVAIVGSGSTGAVSLTTPGGTASLDGFRMLLFPPNFIPNISNAFSPNGDGINDVWVVSFLQDYPQATMQIVNRYGQVVFFSNGYNQPWDGKFKGQALPVGTYYYLINLRNGNPPIAGSVTIIR